MKRIIVIGGGLAGLVSSILLGRQSNQVTLLEKKTYPFHRVCGEYVSNEVVPFLKKHQLFPEALYPTRISRFLLSDTKGRSFEMPLDLGGFGLSRFQFDHWLVQIAKKEGVRILENTTATEVQFAENQFSVQTKNGHTYTADLVIGSQGKRSVIDKSLNRRFMNKRSPYIGVKYHIQTDVADAETVALHNFHGGYCGINKIADEVFNLCYLSKRDNLRSYGNIAEMEKGVLYQNPFLKNLLTNATPVFSPPEVINEISFAPKEPVLDHVLMAGDAAGMITPLSGNGMAMAIHGAALLCDTIHRFPYDTLAQRSKLENHYAAEWRKTFAFRHWTGRQIQLLFGNQIMSTLAVSVGKYSTKTARFLMSKTHGKAF